MRMRKEERRKGRFGGGKEKEEKEDLAAVRQASVPSIVRYTKGPCPWYE